MKLATVVLCLALLTGCGEGSETEGSSEVEEEESTAMEGEEEEEAAEAAANSGEVTVSRGEAGEFTNESGTFSVSFVEAEDLGPVLQPAQGMEGMVEPIVAQQGAFTGIVVEAENTGVAPADFSVEATVVTPDGLTYATDIDTQSSIGNLTDHDPLDDTAQMNPGETARTRYVFDLPTDADLDVLHLSNPYLLAEPASGLFLDLGDVP